MTNPLAGKPLPNNGVAITRRTTQNPSYRTYEVHQRERVGQSTEKIQPIALIRDDQRVDPFANLAILQEHYPCYRDWLSNAYWLTRFDDVTSVFADRANFYVPTRAASIGLARHSETAKEGTATEGTATEETTDSTATDASGSIAAHTAWANLIDSALPDIIAAALTRLNQSAEPDIAIDFALYITTELQRLALGIPERQRDWFAAMLWHIQRADSWQPEVAERGKAAIQNLTDELRRLDVSTNAKNTDTTDYSLRVACAETMPNATPEDLLATVLGFEARTLHGGIANLCQALLTNPSALKTTRTTPQGFKIACLETLRHAPPVATTHCYARHEVERFGRLLPEGALIRLSALAANRDPRQFVNADVFLADRSDLCHREARGQFRADGLATGLSLGIGLPSKHPAEPEDRPRSLYALNRDAIVRCASALFDEHQNLTLCGGVDTRPRALAMFEPHIAWSLPVQLGTEI